MNRVISKDGTSIAYTKVGQGPALILVDGALCYRASGPNEPLAKELLPHFTVYTYDRRGRGESNEAKPYAIEREVEDIAALIEEAGGSAHLYGISSGAALALEAAKRLPSVKKLVVYEAPFVVDGSRLPVPGHYAATFDKLLAANRRGAAVKHFMRKGVGLPAIVTAMMPLMPAWSKLKAVAHTLPYDTLLTESFQRGKPLPADYWSAVKLPTLVLYGGKSPAWMQNGMKALSETLPQAALNVLPGETHIVKPKSLAPPMIAFYLNEQ
ncbi:alpha/beta hydrolase [Cohnella sp. CIP 111063]|mgnify:CR=1 FL=1|jgi:pimeloyl-ACP methyl ester carboxylesterase|uniref:alpha/beta fold hydrolase n=1 Tax=unclassified Cohnella TaxID=2636738 RepID=UPI000B8C1869|nr:MULTISPECIES: alpha/beta hydrolase [unclassified Cohnella]OXS54330.1 alpha/beta hydrolase [Cohnella sp. CIP 111063]PRX63409.1 pimeloyl-ACP methyl ester carboxylesterase [Cohnella sp. SGD-V74]